MNSKDFDVLDRITNHGIHQDNIRKGFWSDEIIITRKMIESELFSGEEVQSVRNAYTSQRLMLIVSELGQAQEAMRKNLNDDVLPNYKGLHVELVDADIRIRDMMGHLNDTEQIDFQQIRNQKLVYNQQRPYKHGKSF